MSILPSSAPQQLISFTTPAVVTVVGMVSSSLKLDFGPSNNSTTKVPLNVLPWKACTETSSFTVLVVILARW